MLPGRLPSSLARVTPAAMAAPCRAAPLGGVLLLLLGDPEGQGAQRRLGGLLVVLGLAVAVDPVGGGGDQRRAPPDSGPAPPGPVSARVDRASPGMGALEQVDGGGQRLAVVGAGELLALAAADQQDPLGRDPGQVVEHQGAAGLAVEVALLRAAP